MDTEKALRAIHKVLKDQRTVLVEIRNLLALPEDERDDDGDGPKRPRLTAAPPSGESTGNRRSGA